MIVRRRKSSLLRRARVDDGVPNRDILEIRQQCNFAAVPRAECSPYVQVNLVGDESHVTVKQKQIDSSRVIAGGAYCAEAHRAGVAEITGASLMNITVRD